MTLSELISLAARCGYMFDEFSHIAHEGYCFIGVLDKGYSCSTLRFDTIADAARYFRREA